MSRFTIGWAGVSTAGQAEALQLAAGGPCVRNPNGNENDETHRGIIGPDFRLTITGNWTNYSKHIDPRKIAAEVGGTVHP